MFLLSLIIPKGGKNQSRNSFCKSSYDATNPQRSLDNHFTTSSLMQKGKSLSQIASCLTPLYLNCETHINETLEIFMGAFICLSAEESPKPKQLQHCISNFQLGIRSYLGKQDCSDITRLVPFDISEVIYVSYYFTFYAPLVIHFNAYFSTATTTRKW